MPSKRSSCISLEGLPVIEMELEQLINGGANSNQSKPVRSTAVG
jgi:hypothetical protein